MIKHTCTIFFLCIGLSAWAQQISISEPIDLDLDYYYNLLGVENNKYYFLKGGDQDYELITIDESLNKRWESSFKMDKKRPKFIDAQLLDRTINVIYHYDEKDGAYLKLVKHKLNGNIIDSSKLEIIYDKLGIRPELRIETSENKRFKLFWNQEGNGLVNYWILDLQKGEIITKNHFPLSNVIGSKQYHKILVSNKGLAFMVLSIQNTKKKVNNHLYKVFKLNTEKAVFKRAFNIEMNGKLTVSVDFTYDNLNDQIIGGGYYGDESIYEASGVFYVRIPSNRNLERVKAFTAVDFQKKLFSNKRRSKNQFTDVFVKDLMLGLNGELIFISEQIRSRTYSDNLTRSTSLKVDYFFTDMYLVSINPNGEVYWINTLKKKQISQNDSGIYSSFFLFKDPKAMRIIFNDEISRDGTVSEYIIRGDGTYDRDIVFNTEKQELGLRLQDSEQVAKNVLLIPSQIKRAVRLVRVTF